MWRCKIWVNHKYSFSLSIGEVHTQAAHKPIHVVAPEYCIDKRRMPSKDLYSQVWFKNLESNKTSLAQFYNLQVLHVFYHTMIILFSTHSCTKTTLINYSCSLDNSHHKKAISHRMAYNIAEIEYTSCYPELCNLVPTR